MDVVPYLSAVILISTIATIALAVLSYAAFKLRDKRRPKARGNAEAGPVFFHRYRPPGAEPAGEPGDAAPEGGEHPAQPARPGSEREARVDR
jgi:hypothetical protein